MSRNICCACGKEIIGQSICVKGEHFHPECFVCGKCKSPIKGQFKTQDGVRICMNCSPTQYCELCKRAVSGTMLKVGGAIYHPECLKCAECAVSLQGAGMCNKDGKMLCSKCASSSGKVTVMNTCAKCKTEEQAGEENGGAVNGEWFCRNCFLCAKCNVPLKVSAVVTDAALQKAGEYSCVCKDCGAQPECPASEQPCIACKKTCSPDPIRLLDGSLLCQACLQCKGCGCTPNTDKPGLLTAKVKSLKGGNYMCSKCDKATESELGTYGGKGKVGRDAVTYCICLRPRHIFWLDYTAMDPVRTTSFHAEGKYARVAKPDGGAALTLTVEMCPFGGGPKSGTVYTAELLPGGQEIVCDGIHCAKTAAADAELHSSGDGGAKIPAFEDGPKAKAPATAEKAASVPKDSADKAAPAAAPAAAPPAASTPAPTKPEEAASPAPKATPEAKVEAGASGKTFALEELKDPESCKAKGVDPTNKEAFLSDGDFQTVFGMAREDFAKLPKWKRDRHKKDVGLF